MLGGTILFLLGGAIYRAVNYHKKMYYICILYFISCVFHILYSFIECLMKCINSIVLVDPTKYRTRLKTYRILTYFIW